MHSTVQVGGVQFHSAAIEALGIEVPEWVGWALLFLAGMAVANLHGCA